MSVKRTQKCPIIFELPNFLSENFKKMKNIFAKNLIYLRELKGETQTETALALNLSRSTYANYEADINQPKTDILLKIIGHFGVEFEKMMNVDLSKGKIFEKDSENIAFENGKKKGKITGKILPQNQDKSTLQIGPQIPQIVTVESNGEENIVFVPVKARAGYLLGYSDSSFIGSLQTFRLPGLNNGSFRMFEVDGISMFNTLHDKDRVIGRWSTLSEIKDGRVYVLVTKNEGVIVKRLINRAFTEGVVICNSDNNHKGEYPPIVVDATDIVEVWYVVERSTRQLPPPGEIYKRVLDLEADMTLLKHKLLKSK